MATAAQAKANRENAQFSTGPRTEEGKNATRYNAYTHGAYATIAMRPGESLDKWTAFRGEYVKEKAPAGLPQILCVEQAALAEFKIMRLPDFETFVARQDENGYPVDWQEDRLMADKQAHLLRCEMHLIRVRDKHLAQLRLHKKDKADETDEPRKAKSSRQRESAAAKIPVAVQPDPQAASPIGTQAAEAAGNDAAELNRWRRIREETAKFISHLQSSSSGLSPVEIGQKIEDHLNEIGLSYPPEAESN